MPASPDRKTVIIRLQPESIRLLDQLCVTYAASVGRRVHRSEMVSLLIASGLVHDPKKPLAKARRK